MPVPQSFDYTPDESGFGELAEYLNGFYGLDDKSTKWNVNVVEGNGMRCLTVSTYFETHMMEVFVDKSKLGVKLEDAEIKSDSWPQVSQRMLTRGDLDKIPTDSLLLLEKEIYNHYYPFNITSTSNDLEQQNANFISCYIEHRTKKERQNRNGGTQAQGSD